MAVVICLNGVCSVVAMSDVKSAEKHVWGMSFLMGAYLVGWRLR